MKGFTFFLMKVWLPSLKFFLYFLISLPILKGIFYLNWFTWSLYVYFIVGFFVLSIISIGFIYRLTGINLLRRLFQRKKDDLYSAEQPSVSSPITKKNNPAFEYVEEKYDIDCTIYRKLSSIIHGQSVAAANEFAELIDEKSNEDLVHFFFDYFLSVIVKGNSTGFYMDKSDVYSALIDGFHGEFYGNVSEQVVQSTVQLWTIKEKCFLKTNLSLDTGNSKGLLISIAANCAGLETIGATEELSWDKPFMQILTTKIISIDKFLNVYNKH